MASTASSTGSTAQLPGATTYPAAPTAHYAHAYPQAYPQTAYPYQTWQHTPATYDQTAAYAPVAAETGAPPPPATDPAVASSSVPQRAHSQPQQQYSANTAAYWQQHQAYHQQQQQAYQHYGQYPHGYYPGQGYAAPASAPQAAPAAPVWPPAAPQRQHPTPQAKTAASPQATYTAAQTNGTYNNAATAASAPVAQPGYLVLPNGQCKPVPKPEPEQSKPFVIKPNMPPKQTKRKFSATAPGGAAEPVYIKIEEVAKQTGPSAKVPHGPDDNPPSLKKFVERCFEDPAFKGSNRQKLQGVLKTMINDAKSKGELWTRDWASAPVPTLTSVASLGSTQIQAPHPMAKAKWAVPATKPFQAKAAQPLQHQQQQQSRAPHKSPARSANSSLSDRSYSYTRSRSRSRSRSSSRSVSPESSYRSPKNSRQGSSHGNTQASPADWRSRNPKRAGPPEPTKKQRKAERKQAKWEAKQKARTEADKKRKAPATSDDGPTPEELQRRKMRSGRFANGAVDQSSRAYVPVYAAELRVGGASSWADSDMKGEYRVAQGTCRNLEKKYFRLTGPPDPSAVRPPPVLWAALKRVVQKYRAGQCDMHYTEDQLKAMRQDATVQSLKGRLPVQIYEAHARACLEHGDSGGFNQCQTVLKMLYGEGSEGCLGEFVAYRVLYQSIFRRKESASLLQEMELLTPQVAAHPAVAHALKVRQALVFARFPAFFQLYAAAPNLGRALMDTCFAKVRFAALETIVDGCKASKVKMHQLASMLGFLVEPSKLAQLEATAYQQSTAVELDGSDSMVLPGCQQTSYSGRYPAEGNAESAVGATEQWLLKCNAVVLQQGESAFEHVLDCKACTALKKPEEASLVSHGDVTLNVESFMHHISVN